MYPEWQKAIREAQKQDELRLQKQEQDEAAKRLAIRIENGRHLEHVLSFFNIKGELDIDVVTIGDYYFKLYTEGREGKSTYYFYHDEKSGVDTLGFNLLVARILPEDESDDFAWPNTVSWLNIGRRHVTEEEKQSWLTGLAYSIDSIDDAYNDLYPKYLKYKAQQSEPKPTPAPVIKKLSIAEQIEALISRMIDEELERRAEVDY